MLAALIAAVGCGGGKPKFGVSGKVMLGDKKVVGEVVFVDANGTEYPAPITDGTYKVQGIPSGEAKVKVRGMPGAGAPLGGGGVGPDGKPLKPLDPGGGAKGPDASGGGVPPPAKYGDEKTSNLKFNVEPKADQNYDIILTP